MPTAWASDASLKDAPVTYIPHSKMSRGAGEGRAGFGRCGDGGEVFLKKKRPPAKMPTGVRLISGVA